MIHFTDAELAAFLDEALPASRCSQLGSGFSWLIDDASLQPADIDYVNAHGTSTTVNDKVETKVCKEVFGDDAPKIPVSSTKSMNNVAQ